MRKYKILFLSHSSKLEGAERSLLAIVKNLDPEKYDELVICPARGDLAAGLQKENIPYSICSLQKWIFSLDYPNMPRFINNIHLYNWILRGEIKKICRIAGKWKPDLIVTNTITISHGAIISRKMHVPHIWFIRELLGKNSHFGRINISGEKAARFVVENSDKIIFNSRLTDHHFTAQIKDKDIISDLNNKKHVIYPFIDNKLTGSSSMKLGHADKEPFKIAVVGSIMPTKGQMEVLTAFREISKEFPLCRLEFAGAIKHKKYYQQMEKFIYKNSIESKVIFWKFIKNIPEYMKTADLIIVPSLAEPFGRTALEGMSLKKPVIISDKSGVAETITSGKDAISVNPLLPGEIALAIKRMLSDVQLRNSIAENGYQKFLQLNNPALFIKNYEKILQELCM